MNVLVLPLGHGVLVKINLEDVERLGLNKDDDPDRMLSNSGWRRSSGYVRRYSNIGSTAMHRVVMGLSDLDGNRLEGHELLVVDHIDGDRCNNTRSNLRLATNRMNAQNTPTARLNHKLIDALKEAEGLPALRESALCAYRRACEDRRRIQVKERDNPDFERHLQRVKESSTPFLEVFGRHESSDVFGF